MRLFDATVTSSVLYGSGCWAMTVERTHRLQTEERKMLRRIVQTPRRYFELADMSVSWVEWVTRATRRAEGLSGEPDTAAGETNIGTENTSCKAESSNAKTGAGPPSCWSGHLRAFA